MKRLLLLTSIFVFLAGCATQQANLDPVEVQREPDYENWDNFFIGGLVPTTVDTPASKACPRQAISRVETETTFLNGLVGGATFGIYTPRTMRIYCER